jgi:hypothetical protein
MVLFIVDLPMVETSSKSLDDTLGAGPLNHARMSVKEGVILACLI